MPGRQHYSNVFKTKGVASFAFGLPFQRLETGYSNPQNTRNNGSLPHNYGVNSLLYS